MRRSDVGEPRAWRGALTGGNVKAFFIDRHGNEPGAGIAKRYAHVQVAWVLNPDIVLSVEENSGDEVNRLLSAVDDEHLARTAAHTAGIGDVIRDSCP